MKKWMIVTIIIVYSFLIGLIIYYGMSDGNKKKKLENKINVLETNLKKYYEEVYDEGDLGKLFVFPGETNVEFDDTGIISGEAFIYDNGNIEIALYDGKYCAYKNQDGIQVTKSKISDCVTNRKVEN